MRRLFTLALSLLLSAAMFAHVTDLPVKTINGKNYYYYTVKQGDTLYSLAKSFGISIDDIISYNPAVNDGLKAMTTIYFPQASFSKPAAKAGAVATDYESYKVSKGETIYGISKQHGITIEQLIEANPKIADGLKSGMTIR
ncbi:MAG: LysM peptidoglycan-binding domain-containing protein, partial [Muribaculaceae bacterium]|nr:LysM peptidoglycan-binding domain-containing protein [Muribaculaceae bacterium]